MEVVWTPLKFLIRCGEMIKPESTILEPDEVAVVYTKDKGYKFLIPDTLDDEEVPNEAAVLVATAMRLSNDEEFYREMLDWLRKDVEDTEPA
jgi:hypothetical protein